MFDDLDNHRIARRAFKRAFVVVRLVWRNSREPHRYVAFSAFREFDIGAINEMARLHKASRLAVQAGARPRLSVTGALVCCDYFSAGDVGHAAPIILQCPAQAHFSAYRASYATC